LENEAKEAMRNRIRDDGDDDCSDDNDDSTTGTSKVNQYLRVL
jgi:hypothetical protein